MKLIYQYGVMSSGKSANLIKILHTFKQQNKTAMVITPNLDTRSQEGYIESRTGETWKADLVEEPDALEFMVSLGNKLEEIGKVDLVIVDECQFMQINNIENLLNMLDEHSPKCVVFFAGLLKDYKNHLFPASQYLLEECDDFQELKSTCYYCMSKATCNLRLLNGEPIYDDPRGDIVPGGDNEYISVCRRHYKNPKDGE